MPAIANFKFHAWADKIIASFATNGPTGPSGDSVGRRTDKPFKATAEPEIKSLKRSDVLGLRSYWGKAHQRGNEQLFHCFSPL